MIFSENLQNYLIELSSLKEDSALKAMEDYAKENYIPIIRKDETQVLTYFIRREEPKRILELGTAMGYSAILMARQREDVEIDSLERDEAMVSLARAHIKAFQLSHRIQVIPGDILDSLPKLGGSYDLIFVDAGKSHYEEYLKGCLDLLAPGGIILFDNVLLRGIIAQEPVPRKHSTAVHNMRAFLEKALLLPGFDAMVLPVGDGLLVLHAKEGSYE